MEQVYDAAALPIFLAACRQAYWAHTEGFLEINQRAVSLHAETSILGKAPSLRAAASFNSPASTLHGSPPAPLAGSPKFGAATPPDANPIVMKGARRGGGSV